MPFLHDETAQFTPSGRITNKVDTASTNNNWTYHFDASGNMTNAASAEQSYALTYDEDNRVTSLFWDYKLPVQFTKLITNRYDALGRRIAKTVDGAETRFALDLAGNMERTLCDMNGAGVITAWYVHGPDLCYKVDATNGLTCYHADAQANIIALTDGNTNIVAQYAYTPYGRSLGSTNFPPSTLNSQPFTFVGSQGVMEELPGLYFMRARYYSADAGVFLYTDPVKHIGPGWKPVAYTYIDGNPFNGIDPTGLSALTRIAGFVNLVGEFRSPVNAGVIIGSGIAYGIGYATGNEALTRHADGGVGIVIRNMVRDAEEVTGMTVDGSINGRAVNNRMGEDAFADDPGMLNNLENLMKYGSYADLALSATKIANTGIQGASAIDAGQWSQTSGFFMKSLGIQLGELGTKLGAKVTSAGNYAESRNSGQSTKPGSVSSHSGTSSSSSGGKSVSSSGNSSFSKTVQAVSSSVSKAANSVSQTVKTAASSAKQSITKAVNSVKSVVSKLFGGGKKK